MSGANGRNVASHAERVELLRDLVFAMNRSPSMEELCAEEKIPNPNLATSNHAVSFLFESNPMFLLFDRF